MKLLLTSLGTSNSKIMDELIRLSGKEPKNSKMLFITTASKPVENVQYMVDELKRLYDRGFQITEYDIFRKSPEELKKQIEVNDIIFVIGGQPFFLLKNVRDTSFDDIIKQLSDDKVYVGQSAGAYLACPTMEMGLWKKPNRNTFGLTDFTGLGLVDFLIFAHHKEIYQPLIEEKTRDLNYKIYTLIDGEAISIDHGDLKFIKSTSQIE